MKYLISLVGRYGCRALLPSSRCCTSTRITAQNKLSPLSVTEDDVDQPSATPLSQRNALIYTNDGESQVMPHPAKVLQLWEPTRSQD